VLLGVSIWLLAPTIAILFRMDELVTVLSALSVRLPIQAFAAVAEALLQRQLRFRQLATIELLSYLAYSIVSVSLALLDFGVWALVSAYLCFTTFRTACLVVIQPHPKRLQLNVQAIKDFMFFSGGVTVSRVFDLVALQGDNVIVGRWLGAEALGIYGRAYHLTVTPSSELGNIVQRVMFPAMATVQNQPLRLTTAYLRGVGLMALLIVPLSVAAFVLAPEIIYIVLGPDWSAVVAPFRILALGMFFRTSCKLADTLARSKGAVYELAWRHGVYAALVVTGAWMAYPFGIEGVALAVVIALAVHFMLMIQLSVSITHTRWSEFCLAHLPALFLAGITGIAVLTVAEVARYYMLPPIVVSVSAVAFTLSCLLVLSRLIPSWILGRDAAWLLEALSRLRSGR
jgi:O-antigen/teichoic acid export membrane protein